MSIIDRTFIKSQILETWLVLSIITLTAYFSCSCLICQEVVFHFLLYFVLLIVSRMTNTAHFKLKIKTFFFSKMFLISSFYETKIYIWDNLTCSWFKCVHFDNKQKKKRSNMWETPQWIDMPQFHFINHKNADSSK